MRQHDKGFGTRKRVDTRGGTRAGQYPGARRYEDIRKDTGAHWAEMGIGGICLVLSLNLMAETKGTETREVENSVAIGAGGDRQPGAGVDGGQGTRPGSTGGAGSGDPFAPLLTETRPLKTIWETDYRNNLELGLAYTSDDSVRFGEYNGLDEEGLSLLGSLSWQYGSGAENWKVELEDLGRETRSGRVEWRFSDKKLWLSFDNSIETRDRSTRTPFFGDAVLRLPADWEPGATTGEFSALERSLRGFTEEIERQKAALGYSQKLGRNWSMAIEASVEEKEGSGDIGAAIYTNASNPHAVLLPQPIDYRHSELSLDFNYSGDRLRLAGRFYYSDFVNNDEVLRWQNPYLTGWNGAVNYPAGEGGLALAPDNRYINLRGTATYLINNSWHLALDGSLGRATQDETFSDYSVNAALQVFEPLPRTDLDGEVDTGTFSASLRGRLNRKLSLDFQYRLSDRNNDNPRDAYQYIRGDGDDQPGAAYRVYNTTHDNLKQSFETKLDYRLFRRSKLTTSYRYEQVERENAAVEKTEDNQLGLAFRTRLADDLSLRAEVTYSDLAADTYHWDQSYYALLDPLLINQIPDSQRYINHPLLSQYHLANRERARFQLDVNHQLSARWQSAFNLSLSDDDYDKSVLGLIAREQRHVNFSLTYSGGDGGRRHSFTGFISFDDANSAQGGRAFRGGSEKNAFELFYGPTSPLPQASDPTRNWWVDSDNEWITLGFNWDWRASDRFDVKLEYSFVDTQGLDRVSNGGAGDLDDTPFPERDERIHHLQVIGEYHLRENLSLKTDYQFYRDSGDNWSIDGVQADTLDKVLTLGARQPDEVIHYIGTSFIYRW